MEAAGSCWTISARIPTTLGPESTFLAEHYPARAKPPMSGGAPYARIMSTYGIGGKVSVPLRHFIEDHLSEERRSASDLVVSTSDLICEAVLLILIEATNRDRTRVRGHRSHLHTWGNPLTEAHP